MGNNLELKLEVIVKYLKLMVYSENLLNDLDWKILYTVRNYEYEIFLFLLSVKIIRQLNYFQKYQPGKNTNII